jgi:hypothetical protein
LWLTDMSKPKPTLKPKPSNPKPLTTAQRQAKAGLARKIAEGLAAIAQELHDSEPTPEREAELLRKLAGVTRGFFDGREIAGVQRMFLVHAVLLTAQFQPSSAAASVRLVAAFAFENDVTDEALQLAVDAFARDGKPREKSTQPLRWEAMATLVNSAGLGPVKASTLEVEWSKWKNTKIAPQIAKVSAER